MEMVEYPYCPLRRVYVCAKSMGNSVVLAVGGLALPLALMVTRLVLP
jgi:hypothetical protein